VTDIGIVFPRANLLGGVERVAWDLLNYLGLRYQAAFVGEELLPTESPNVQHFRVDPRPTPTSLRPLAFRRAVERTLRGRRPRRLVTMGAVCPPGDVLWVQSVHRAWLASSSAIRVGPVHVPASARRLKPWHQTLLALERQYFTRSDPQWILCTSQREADDLVHYYDAPHERMVVVPNGFDGQRFNLQRRCDLRDEMRQRLGIADHEIALLFVANELHRKGFVQTVQAIAALRDQHFSLHVVGRAPLDAYATEIARLGVGDRVRYHGPTDRVEDFHAAADALVLPTQYEPFGLVIIEAMASGLPVVTTKLAGAAGAIDDGVSGLLQSDPYDVEELSSLLARLQEPAVREEMGEHAAKAAAGYEWGQVFQMAEPYLMGA